ncbi:SMI1/KNR4 family protein [Roseateles chitinivorans]|uniref:SMI1/KNR4 family protein n=1 Tax=Roseateles chitinivorans TaxID=2917965 RepID=UPI003D66B8D2
MNDTTQQTRRILAKLAQAKAADPKLEVFGSNTHGYALHAPAKPQALNDFEARLAITLPTAYRQFLLDVGNGGNGSNSSGAGPFYGVYGIGNSMGAMQGDSLAKAVAKPCVLSPGMSPADWDALVAHVGLDGKLDDEAYDQAVDTLFGGLLPIGSQGCSMYHGVVLNGPYRGRVVNFDMERSGPPVFAFEPDFLAWYERWLDEVIAGDLQRGPPGSATRAEGRKLRCSAAG